VVACAGKIFAGICYALATEEWVYYLGVYLIFMKTCKLKLNLNSMISGNYSDAYAY